MFAVDLVGSFMPFPPGGCWGFATALELKHKEKWLKTARFDDTWRYAIASEFEKLKQGSDESDIDE